MALTPGIAQQTLAHYQGGQLRLPASLLPTLAQGLQLHVEDLPGQHGATQARAKRRPALAQQGR